MKDALKSLQKDPFRLFFPLGIFFGVFGVLPWSFLLLHPDQYPRDFHRALMINGFLLSFVSGFLMTAIPRMTRSRFAELWEIIIVLLALAISDIGAWMDFPVYVYLGGALALAGLILFGAQRFLKREANPPPTFLFVGLGLALWLMSDIAQIATTSERWLPVWQDIFTNGAIMSLILGVGGRLIPGILGWQEVLASSSENASQSYLEVIPKDVWICLALFMASYFLETTLSFRFCLIMRGAVVIYFAFKYWHVYQKPKVRTFLSWSIWFCSLCLAFGYFVPAIWTGLYVHAMHIVFIAGFSLLTLLISTRVIFAHGTKGTAREATAKTIFVFTALIFVAAVTRFSAPFWPRVYLQHLAYAALIWILALGFWLWTVFIKKSVFLN